jgi:hypothetical protein
VVVRGNKQRLGVLEVLAVAVGIAVAGVALRKETQAARRDTVTLVGAAPITDLPTRAAAAVVLGRLVERAVLQLPVAAAMDVSIQLPARTHTTRVVALVKERLTERLTATALPV